MIFRTITDDITGANKSIGLFGRSLNDVKGIISSFKQNGIVSTLLNTPLINIDTNAIDAYNNAIRTGTPYEQALAEARRTTNASTLALIESSHGLEIQTERVTAVQKASTIAAKAHSVALKAVSIALNIGLMIAINAVISGIMKLARKQEELRQSAQESANTYKETSSSIKDYATRYKELQEALTAAKGNEEETYNVKKQLLDLQTELNEKYGDEYGRINLVTEAYKDQTEAVKAYNKEAAQKFLNENVGGIKEAERQMTEQRNYALSYGELSSYTEKGMALREIAEKYADRGMYLNDMDDGQFSIHLEADAQSAYDTINAFESDLREKAKELGDETLFDDIFSLSSDTLNDTKKVIDDYGDIFNQALTAEIASDDDKAVKYNEALEAVNAFNKAVLQSEDVYNDKNVDNARQSLQEIKEELESSEEWEKYSLLIDDVFEQADTKLLDFNNHIKNDDSIRKLAEDLEGLDDLDLKAFDENIGENTSFDKLKESAESYGLSVEELIDTLVRLGYVQGEISNQEQQSPYALSIDEAKKAVNGTDDVVGLIEEYQLLQEVLSDTGNIQEETYAKLLSCSSKYSTAIRTENGRITVNTSKLKAVAKSRQLDTKEAIRQTLALKKQEWVQWNQGIENYNGVLLENIKTTYGDIDALQSQITQYELLANSVDNASSAFENFKNAQSTEDQDMYNTAQEMFEVLKGYTTDPENENFGKYNRDEFQEAAIGMMDNKTYKKFLNAKDLDEAQKIVDGFIKTIEPLFDEKNYNSANNLFDRINEIMDGGNVPESAADWAKRLGISEELFHALAAFGNQYDFANKEIFEGYQLNTLDEYQSLLSNVKTAQEALNECTDKTSNEYAHLSKELEDAKQKYNEFKNETADTLEDAYADYIHSGAKSKGDFAEYLKKNLDFDDSDVTGSIDVLLDRVSELETEMSKIPQASEPYKKLKQELDEMNSLASNLGYSKEQNASGAGIGKDSLKKDISDYRSLAMEAAKYKRTLENSKEGSSAYKEAEKGLERIKAQMDDMREPLRIRIESNMSEIDSELSRLDEKIKGFKESLKHASGSKEAYAIHMDIKGVENEKAKLEGQKSDLEKTVKIIMKSEEAFSDIEKLQKETIEDKVFDIIANDKASPVLKEINELQLQRKELNVDVKVNNPAGIDLNGSASNSDDKPNPFLKYGIKADGTFNAFAQGTGSNVSIKKDEKALVNELGEEGVVRNGKLIPIKGGAQFIKLKRGDIVFNHKQMEQLRKNGYATGRGKLIGAHADGTINAYAGTGNGYRINMPNLKDVMENNRAIQQAKNESKKAVEEEAKEAAEQVKEASEEVFDWIEKRIESFKRKFDKWIKRAETAVTSGFVTKYYKKATNAIKKELSAYGKAYGRYMKEANAVGLDKKYRDKVKNGTIDIETIQDEELAEKIQKYQEWYNYYAPLSGNRCRHSI